MKKNILFITLFFCISTVFAQIPNEFKYQAVLRNLDGTVMANNTNLTINISILEISETGSEVFSETHSSISTNNQGLFALNIGSQNSALFATIDWAANKHFIKLTINGTEMGTSQLLSVPYALSAKTVEIEDYNNLINVPEELGAWTMVSSNLYVTNTLNNVGIGTTSPGGKLEVHGDINDDANSILFEVKDKDGNTVFKVTPTSVEVIIDDEVNSTRANKKGFAVSGRNTTRAGGSDFFTINAVNNPYIIEPAESRIVWYPYKEAFLSGKVLIQHADSIGQNSFSTGSESRAIGNFSQAMGFECSARGVYSTAIGYQAQANDSLSFAMGDRVLALGKASTAMGSQSKALGLNSVAFGDSTIASGPNSFALGKNTTASGKSSFAMGRLSAATGLHSVAVGEEAYANGTNSFAFGKNVIADSINSFVFGAGFALGGSPLKNEIPNSLMIGFKTDTALLFVGPSSSDIPGGVGIGTSSPTHLLEINGNSVNSNIFKIQNTNPNGQSSAIFFNDTETSLFKVGNYGSNSPESGSAFIWTKTNNHILFGTSDFEQMRIQANGNVGIGINNPQRKLHVKDVMRLEPRAVPPLVPSAGDLYFDSNSQKLRCFDGTVWQNCY